MLNFLLKVVGEVVCSRFDVSPILNRPEPGQIFCRHSPQGRMSAYYFRLPHGFNMNILKRTGSLSDLSLLLTSFLISAISSSVSWGTSIPLTRKVENQVFREINDNCENSVDEQTATQRTSRNIGER